MKITALLPTLALLTAFTIGCSDEPEPVAVEQPRVVAPAPAPVVEEAPPPVIERAEKPTVVTDPEGGTGTGADYLTPEEVRYRSSDERADWSKLDRSEMDGFDDM